MSKPSASAVWLRRFNAVATAFWTVMLPVAILTGLKDSVPFLVGVSVYALAVGHLGAWVSARAEVASEENP